MSLLGAAGSAGIFGAASPLIAGVAGAVAGGLPGMGGSQEPQNPANSASPGAMAAVAGNPMPQPPAPTAPQMSPGQMFAQGGTGISALAPGMIAPQSQPQVAPQVAMQRTEVPIMGTQPTPVVSQQPRQSTASQLGELIRMIGQSGNMAGGPAAATRYAAGGAVEPTPDQLAYFFNERAAGRSGVPQRQNSSAATAPTMATPPSPDKLAEALLAIGPPPNPLPAGEDAFANMLGLTNPDGTSGPARAAPGTPERNAYDKMSADGVAARAAEAAKIATPTPTAATAATGTNGVLPAGIPAEGSPLPPVVQRVYTAPPEGYRPGIDPEWNYFSMPQPTPPPVAGPAGDPTAAARAAETRDRGQPGNSNGAEGRAWEDQFFGRIAPKGNDGPAPVYYEPGNRDTPDKREVSKPSQGLSTATVKDTKDGGGGGILGGNLQQGIRDTLDNAEKWVRDTLNVNRRSATKSSSPSGGVKKSASGGRVTYRPTGGAPLALSAGGLADIAEGAAPTPAPQMNDKQLVEAATAAIKGEIPEQQAAMVLAQFVEAFGEDGLRQLVSDVQSGRADAPGGDMEGKITGAGDGMADMVPARMDDGASDVLLSDGEYIVPADVVSGLGNGSTDAGAAELDAMLGRVRETRTGMAEQPAKMSAGRVLPV